MPYQSWSRQSRSDKVAQPCNTSESTAITRDRGGTVGTRQAEWRNTARPRSQGGEVLGHPRALPGVGQRRGAGRSIVLHVTRLRRRRDHAGDGGVRGGEAQEELRPGRTADLRGPGRQVLAAGAVE